MSEHNEEYTADDPRLTAYALGELEAGDEVQAIEAFIAKSPEAQAAVEEIRACTGMLELELAEVGCAELSSEQRAAIDAELEPRVLVPRERSRVLRVGAWAAAAAAVGAFVWVFLGEATREDSGSFLYTIFEDEDGRGDTQVAARIEPAPESKYFDALENELGAMGYAGGRGEDLSGFLGAGEDAGLRGRVSRLYSGEQGVSGTPGVSTPETPYSYTPEDPSLVRPVLNIKQDGNILAKRENYYDRENSDSYKKLTEYLATKAKQMEREPLAGTDASGRQLLRADQETPFDQIQKVMNAVDQETIRQWKLQLAAGQAPEDEAPDAQVRATIDEVNDTLRGLGYTEPLLDPSNPSDVEAFRDVLRIADEPTNNEQYSKIVENPFIPVDDDSLSTFSIDVDTASYANTRRHLLVDSKLPPPDAVRIEELVNYFPYDYPSPDASQPFSVNVEIASAPWQPKHRLVKVGLKGREPVYSERKNANLVFLIDVSGSMNEPAKLPLLVESLTMLVKNLDSTDRVAIVVYAGSSGLVLDSTSCSEKPLLIGALERLRAGGSTNGGQGIRLAYAVAQRNFVEGGINRVVLATDGDFNVGTTSLDALEELITEKAKDGVFLSVLGFGRANFNDSRMEMLADKGNGNYSYIDSRIEGHKVLVEQLGGTLVAIAKDVKIQIEFNPAEVQAFRLIGYENRVLAHQDFNDDTKDAGEIGSGHTVTALYEVVPQGVEFELFSVDPLRYQADAEGEKVPTEAANSGELLTLKLRYKEPEGSVSRKIVHAVHDEGASFDKASEDFHFAASVASFGMLLRGSRYKGRANWEDTLRLAQAGQGADAGGYRLEFTYLVQRAAALSR